MGTKKVLINFRVTPFEKKLAEAVAKQEHRSLTNFIVWLIKGYEMSHPIPEEQRRAIQS